MIPNQYYNPIKKNLTNAQAKDSNRRKYRIVLQNYKHIDNSNKIIMKKIMRFDVINDCTM